MEVFENGFGEIGPPSLHQKVLVKRVEDGLSRVYRPPNLFSLSREEIYEQAEEHRVAAGV